MLYNIPRARTEFGKRASSIAAPRYRNELPFDLRHCSEAQTFKRRLKTPKIVTILGVFSLLLNVCASLQCLRSNGSSFRYRGAAIEEARFPNSVLARGILYSIVVADRSLAHSTMLETGTHPLVLDLAPDQLHLLLLMNLFNVWE